MGCFESKDQIPVQPYEDTKQRQALKPSRPVRKASEQPEKVLQSLANKEKDDGEVVSVPRPVVAVGERERAELKVKNMRDKLLTNISLSEEVMRQDALLALRMRKEGKQASARILLRKRRLAQRRILKSETMLKQVMETIDTLDTAKDNAKFVEALKQGTAAIKEITKDVSAERVHDALADSNKAVEYVQYVGKIMEQEADAMTDEQVEEELDKLAKEFDMTRAETNTVEAVKRIPGVPTQQPEPSPTPATEQKDNMIDDEHALAV